MQPRSNPPPPPEEVSEPFVNIVGTMFGVPRSELAILKSRDDVVSDRISIDLYDRDRRGLGGSTGADISKRLRSIKAGKLPVALQIQAEAFRGALPMLGVLGTGMHEGTHYRHYAFLRQMIENWQKGTGRRSSSKEVDEAMLRSEFGRFIDQEVKRKHISNDERTILHSTFGVTQATHPIAQFHAFMGAYGNYPRERDTRKTGRSLVNQSRFEQLLVGAVHWRDVWNPGISELCVKALADFARQKGAECTLADLQGLGAELVALQSHAAAKFFERLNPLLAAP
jgi:hypothetical protein